MWSALGLLVLSIIPEFGFCSHGFKTKQIQTDDILLDGRIYRQVGEYEEDGDTDINVEEEVKVHPLTWLFKSVMEFWKGKKLKNHHKHGKLMDENEKNWEKKTFNFHPQFQWLHGRDQHRQFRENPTAYKSKYYFKSEEEKFFEQIRRRSNHRRPT